MQRAVIERDGRCMWTGRIDDTLVGHHLFGWGATGIDEEWNMITLCAAVHDEVERGYLTLPGGEKVYDADERLMQIMRERYAHLYPNLRNLQETGGREGNPEQPADR